MWKWKARKDVKNYVTYVRNKRKTAGKSYNIFGAGFDPENDNVLQTRTYRNVVCLHQRFYGKQMIDPRKLTHRVHMNTIDRMLQGYMAKHERAKYDYLRKQRNLGELLPAEEIEYQILRKRARKFRKVRKRPRLHQLAFVELHSFALIGVTDPHVGVHNFV